MRMDVFMASDRFDTTVTQFMSWCVYGVRLHLVMPHIDPRFASLSCVASISTRSQVEGELALRHPPWTTTDTVSKHDTFYNLVRFYAASLTVLENTSHFLLVDDDVRLMNPDIFKHFDWTVRSSTDPMTADCSFWSRSAHLPIRTRLLEAYVHDMTRLLTFLVHWPFFKREVLMQQWWNFGVVRVDARRWRERALTERFELAIRTNERLAYPFATDTLAYGLMLPQLAFAGHVGCWEDGVIGSGLGFAPAAAQHANHENVSLIHYNGDIKPWSRRLSDRRGADQYDFCTLKWWAQCGGRRFRSTRCCAVGWRCDAVNAWYSHCVPHNTNRCVQNKYYSQCGGRAFTGQTCCPDGSTCRPFSAYYSQCVPS